MGGPAAAALSTDCCGMRGTGAYAWLDARREVPGASDLYHVASERNGPDYTTVPTCFDDAFVTTVATLTTRIGRHGATTPGVRAWLATQNAVFGAHSAPGTALPALPGDVPDWLRADRR